MRVSKYREMTIIMKTNTHALVSTYHEPVSLTSLVPHGIWGPVYSDGMNVVVTIQGMNYAWFI
jgi:hypothetical protein